MGFPPWGAFSFLLPKERGLGDTMAMREMSLSLLPGNRRAYSPSLFEEDKDSPLLGETMLFLGSSVTRGYGSLGDSFPECFHWMDGVIFTKEAVDGTTLADKDEKSYLSRLRNHEGETFEYMFVQLSTNDACQKVPLGNKDSHDTGTTFGSLNEILGIGSKISATLPIVWSNPYFKNERYREMVAICKEIAAEGRCLFLNLYEDPEVNSISKKERRLYLMDDIHPTKAGYRDWLFPYIRDFVLDFPRPDGE